MRFKPVWLGCFFFLLLTTLALAAMHFPKLTGRVVDNAHILTEATEQSLEQTLADYENGTTNQVVVVTLPSLEGYSIEEYGYQLGRAWHIGQKDKNNGVLLIVAPNEKKVRIEVGYGLEPVLTDAASSEVVHGIILPDFRNAQMEKGVVDGTQAILSVLGGKGVPSYRPQNDMNAWEAWLILLLFLWFFLFSIFHPRAAFFLLLNSPSRFGSSRLSSSGWGGGGFSGGGGSFGGGGASGGW